MAGPGIEPLPPDVMCGPEAAALSRHADSAVSELRQVNTHNHILQGMLGQPAVQEHWDEKVPQREPHDLKEHRDCCRLSHL